MPQDPRAQVTMRSRREFGDASFVALLITFMGFNGWNVLSQLRLPIPRGASYSGQPAFKSGPRWTLEPARERGPWGP